MSKVLMAFALAAGLAGTSWAQDKPEKQDKPPSTPKEEAELSIEEAMKMLKEVGKLMETAEELLNDASRGKALETERELMEKIDKLLKEDSKENPSDAQKKVLEKIQKLMGKSEKSQGQSADKMGEVIRRVKAAQGQGQGQPGQPQPGQQPKPQGQKPDQPSNPADKPYDPNRNGEPINKFRSKGDRSGRWGDLPARVREAMLSGKRAIDDFPAEYQQVLKEYMKRLADEKE
jgi:ElaB/YqjD/DUF883 family membrane-anchored ribosome-binding protein